MKRLNVLISYPYMTKPIQRVLVDRQDDLNIFVDSGAFTVWKGGGSVDLDEYCQFIKGLPFKPHRYFALDVIGDHEGSMKNYNVMLRRGLTPVPVIHEGEPLAVMDEYYGTSNLVGIGGIADPTKRNEKFFTSAVKKAGQRDVHLLGFTSLSWLKALRPWSCDSSSWESARRFGTSDLYFGRGRMKKIKRDDFKNRPNEEVQHRIRQLGIDPVSLRSEDGWRGGRSTSAQLAACSWVSLMNDMDKNIDTKLVLAFCREPSLQNLLYGLEVIRGEANA